LMENDEEEYDVNNNFHSPFKMSIDKNGMAQFRNGEIRAPWTVLALFYHGIHPCWPVDIVRDGKFEGTFRWHQLTELAHRLASEDEHHRLVVDKLDPQEPKQVEEQVEEPKPEPPKPREPSYQAPTTGMWSRALAEHIDYVR